MRYLLLIALLYAGLTATAQVQTGFSNRMGENTDRGPSLTKIEEKGAEALKEGDEYLAMDYYSRVIAADSNRVTALRGFAEAALRHSALPQARSTNERLLKINPNDEAAKLSLAEIWFREGAYEKAQTQFTSLLSSSDNAVKDAAEKGVEHANWAIVRRDNSDFSKTAILLDSTINTEYSEYMNWPNNDGTFYFSSYKFPFKGDRGDRKRDRRLVKTLLATPVGETFTSAITDYNEDKRHTLHPTLNAAGDMMFYAQGDFINSAEIRCELYMRRKAGGSWGAPQKLGPEINIDGFTSTEPNVGRFPGADLETLFFVSDRPGTKGGRDIWYANILPDGSVAAPVNLNGLNSETDDVTPFYHSATGTMYFSTTGAQTMGGFDVYKSVGSNATWSTPAHLEPPVNSYANDVFFTITGDAAIAYMSSNRFGSANISEEACCYDIFQVPLIKPKMVAVAFNATTKDSLMRTNIRLYEMRDGKPFLVDSAMNIPGAFYPFSVSPGKAYMVIADKPGFKSDTTPFVTPRTVWPGIMSQHLFLTPMKVDLIAKVYDKKTKEPITGATARFVDLGPVAGNTPAPKSNPNGLVSSNPSGNDYYYPLEFDHNYKVYISKNGYTIDSAYVTTKGLKESTTLTADLYLERGVKLEAQVYDVTSRTQVPITGVTFKLFDISKDLKEPRLVAQDLRQLDNDFASVLDYGRRYRVIALKEGFSSDTIDFVVPAVTNKPFELIQKELEIHSLELEKYLPIRLYFDNDYPNPRTLATTTTRLYSQTYFAYYPKKDTFISVYTDKLVGAQKEKAIQALEVFFEDSLKGEWNRLRFFTEVLFDKLKRGEHVEISIKGFASPRAPSGYNKNLTSRRIASIMNHFSSFDGALLKKYIETNQLVVTEVPNGEAQSRPGVADNYFDPRNSVFSPEASKERRVEIVGIEFTKGQ